VTLTDDVNFDGLHVGLVLIRRRSEGTRMRVMIQGRSGNKYGRSVPDQK
jgi:hypothetical protein